MPDPTLDPDLEQVLEDIAADPRAKLFITEPRKILTGFLDGSLETPASRTGLRPAARSCGSAPEAYARHACRMPGVSVRSRTCRGA